MASALYNARLSDVRGAPRHSSGRWLVVASLQMPLLHTGRHIEHRQWLPTANQARRALPHAQSSQAVPVRFSLDHPGRFVVYVYCIWTVPATTLICVILSPKVQRLHVCFCRLRKTRATIMPL